MNLRKNTGKVLRVSILNECNKIERGGVMSHATINYTQVSILNECNKIESHIADRVPWQPRAVVSILNECNKIEREINGQFVGLVTEFQSSMNAIR